jgi:hypothetical protein
MVEKTNLRQAQKQKRFVKYDVHGNLFGSLRYDLSPAELSIWDRLLALGKLSSVEGVVLHSEWTAEAIVSLFNLTPYGGMALFKGAIDKLVKTERVQVLEDGSYNIINWHKYQDTPSWVVNTRENLMKAISKRDRELREIKVQGQELRPSKELEAVANQISSATNKLMGDADEE